jgi:predicted amidohydrolase
MVQMDVAAMQRSANLSHVLRRLHAAAGQEPAPELVLLPGACDAGSLNVAAELLTEELSSVFVETIAERAQESGVYVAAGTLERDRTGIFHTVVLLDTDGDVLLKHRQIICDAERSVVQPGRDLAVVSVDDFPVGLLAGTDLECPSLASALSAMGARLILVCAACPAAGNIAKLAAERAKQAAVHLALCTTAKDGGCSALFGPDGRSLVSATTRDEQILSAEVPEDVARTRKPRRGPGRRPPLRARAD